MSIEEICQIAQIEPSDENKEIIEKYTKHIIAWITSDEFKQNWANKPFPPLINPAVMDYAGSDASHAWVLNLPLPKYYDFVVFGAHASGLHSAIPAFLYLCGCGLRTMYLREIEGQKEGHKGNKGNYIRMYDELVLAKQLKDRGDIKYSFLQLSDLCLDKDGVKFFSLVDASKALHVVKDPLEIIKSHSACPHRLEKLGFKDSDESVPLGVFLDTDPREFAKNHIFYSSPNVKDWMIERPKMPDINSAESWIMDGAQNFHNALMFALLKGSLKVVKLKQTNDFIGNKCFDTMKEVAEFLGIDAPKEQDRWLFEKRVSDYKHFLPLRVYANDEMSVFDGSNARKISFDKSAYYMDEVSKEVVENSVEFIISTAFSDLSAMASDQDISELFELGDDVMRVFIRLKDAIKLLKNPNLLQKAKKYIKMLTNEIKEQAKIENTKKFKASDLLEYLEKHPKIAFDLKEILEQDLSVLRANKPEIIDGWQTYQDFLKLCEKLQKEQKDIELKPMMSNLSVCLALMDSRLVKSV